MRMPAHSIALAGICWMLVATGSYASEADQPDRPIPEVVDHYIDELQHREEVQPGPTADDATLLRRLTLDLAGRIPTSAEARAFRASKRRTRSSAWSIACSPRRVTSAIRPTKLDAMLMGSVRGSLRDYLARAVGENRPWDRIFRDLMLPDQSDPAGKVAAGYLRARIKDTDRLTAEVSATFFGVNIGFAPSVTTTPW